MKKLLLLSVLVLSSHVASLAQSIVIDGNEYLLLSNGKAALKKVCSDGFQNYAYDECTIPETFEAEGQTYTVTQIEQYAFKNSFAKSVHLPQTIKHIEGGAFYKSMTSTVNIPESIDFFDPNAFVQSDIKEVTIPATADMGSYYENGLYFYLTPKLLNIFVGKSHPYFKDIDGVFCTNDGKLIKYPEARSGVYVTPEGIKSIGYSAFLNSNLDKLVLSEGVEDVNAVVIGPYVNNVYYSTKYITPKPLEVYVGSTVKKFYANFPLRTDVYKSVDVYFFSKEPPTVGLGTIDSGASFTLHVPYGCKKVYASKLNMSYIPDNMKIVEMEEGTDLASFGLSTAETFRTDTYNTHLDARWPFALYDKIPYFIKGSEAAVADTRLRSVGYALPDFVIPEYITVNDVSYPVTEIDDYGFWTVLHGEKESWWMDLPATTVTLNSRIRRIGVQAFCEADIQRITLPESLEEIDSLAFLDTQRLTKVTCLAKTPPACSEKAWYGRKRVSIDVGYITVIAPSSVSRTLYVPEGTVDLYRTAPGWKEFSQIVEIGTNKIDAVQYDAGNSYSHNSYYDLQGRRLTGKPAKGIYIQNGRKVLVK